MNTETNTPEKPRAGKNEKKNKTHVIRVPHDTKFPTRPPAYAHYMTQHGDTLPKPRRGNWVKELPKSDARHITCRLLKRLFRGITGAASWTRLARIMELIEARRAQ
ncbi:MAG: hypothetical protein ABI443_04955 [Chthoniobacterales bacterium]